MLRGKYILITSVCFILMIIYSCKRENKLQKTIRTELQSGDKYDSLFLGLKFGIDLQSFYDHCWDLNRKGIVKEGPRNMSVEYIFKDSLNNPIAFNFYAQRDETIDGKVHRYHASFYYYAWALNRHLYSNALIKMLNPILMDWYGGNEPFAQVKDGKTHFYKIDGNRMIDFFIHDESTVIATFTDLSYYKEQEAQNE